MSLQTRIQDLATRIGQEIKAAYASLGALASLTTTDKTTIVGAINEVDANADSAQAAATTAQNQVGTLASLTTTAKGSAVAAINEVKDTADDKLDTAETTGNALILPHGAVGGYQDGYGSTGDWGASIWSIGRGFKGAIAGGNKDLTGQYGIVWLRNDHPQATVGEGLYLAINGAVLGALARDGLSSKYLDIDSGTASELGRITGGGPISTFRLENIQGTSAGAAQQFFTVDGSNSKFYKGPASVNNAFIVDHLQGGGGLVLRTQPSAGNITLVVERSTLNNTYSFGPAACSITGAINFQGTNQPWIRGYSSTQALTIAGNTAAANSSLIQLFGSDNASGGDEVRIFTGAKVRIRLRGNGRLAIGDDAMAVPDDANYQMKLSGKAWATQGWETVSDSREKQDFEDVTGALEKLSQLSGKKFRYRGGQKRQAGLIAEEWEAVLPEAVSEVEVGEEAKEGETYDRVDTVTEIIDSEEITDPETGEQTTREITREKKVGIRKRKAMDLMAPQAFLLVALKELQAEVEQLKAEVSRGGGSGGGKKP